MSVLIDGSWWSSRCGGRRARRSGPERERYGRRGDGRRGRSGPRLVARVLDVGAVDADRGRADEALAIGQAVGIDLAHEDLVGIEPELGHRRAQLLECLRVRRAAIPEQQLDLWLRHLPGG